ncbi:STAS domain-containing protein, partial [Nonomuraea fuscirosea]|uniref:STAS domain-containing protein n=1 Tax=Nonomuraea fuscirosea TaxID=1291556 RepID=UPI00343A0F12
MRVRGNPRAQVVRIGARLDAGTSAGVRERLHEALDSGEGDLILDLSKLEMIDATGLGVGSHRRARHDHPGGGRGRPQSDVPLP